jgi:hypothetical protein
MTTAIDAGSSGGAGTGPGGGAGTGPRPSGPTAPTPSKRAELLDTADLLLRTLEVLDAREFEAFADLPAERVAFTSLLGYTRRAVANLAVAAHVPPARQSDSAPAVGAIATPGEPGLKPPFLGGTGRPTPSLGDVFAARPPEAAQVAGADVRVRACPGDGRVGGAPGAATFAPPKPLGPPRFTVGARRLVGRVEPVLLNP